MIDLHCHILPGLDDGAGDEHEALEMARIAAADGITDIVATPHTFDGVHHNRLIDVLYAVKDFQSLLDRHGIPLRIFPGSEVRIHPELIKNAKAFEVALCNQCRYVLLELPSNSIPSFTEDLIDEMRNHGLTPMIAHPERNAVLRDNLRILADWIEKGVIAQVNAGSLTGQMGKRTKAVAEQLIKQRLVHVVASDAHDPIRRRPELEEAYQLIAKLTSREEAERFLFNAEAVLWGEDCQVPEPMVGREKKWIIF